MNTNFDELASLLVIASVQRCDRDGILETAIEHIKRQAALIKELEERQCLQGKKKDESIRALIFLFSLHLFTYSLELRVRTRYSSGLLITWVGIRG